jgi:acetylglutamate kinase
MKKTVLIKLGGKSLEGEEGYLSLGRAIKLVADANVVVVHGGGAEISQALKAANRQPVFIDGLRVTTPEDVTIVERVLSEDVNSRIAGYFQQSGLQVCRLSGKSRSLLIVEKWLRNGQDLGCVGQVVKVHPQAVLDALQQQRTPVISPISADVHGETYNVNADSAAAALAGSLQCSDLIYFTDVAGVQVNGKVAPVLTLTKARDLIEKGIIHGGMTAKLESAFAALAAGVGRVHISAWQGDATLRRILDGEYDFGTAVVS